MLTTQTDPPVTPVTPVPASQPPCKCSQTLSEHWTNSHTVTPWQKGLKALDDTLNYLDAFEAGTRERPPRLDGALVDWFHRKHPSDLGLTFNAIKPRLDAAWAEHARREEADAARLQELQRRAGAWTGNPVWQTQRFQDGSERLRQLVEALSEFEAGTRRRPPIVPDTLGPWYHRNFADLAEVWDLVKPRLDRAWDEYKRRQTAIAVATSA